MGPWTQNRCRTATAEIACSGYATWWKSPSLRKHLLRNRPIYGYVFEGTRYDAGDKLGFLKATVELALHRYDLGNDFRAYLKGLKL